MLLHWLDLWPEMILSPSQARVCKIIKGQEISEYKHVAISVIRRKGLGYYGLCQFQALDQIGNDTPLPLGFHITPNLGLYQSGVNPNNLPQYQTKHHYKGPTGLLAQCTAPEPLSNKALVWQPKQIHTTMLSLLWRKKDTYRSVTRRIREYHLDQKNYLPLQA